MVTEAANEQHKSVLIDVAFSTVQEIVQYLRWKLYLLESTLDLRYQCFTITSFALLFRNKKYVKAKKQVVQISSCVTVYIYTCVLCTHIQIHVC